MSWEEAVVLRRPWSCEWLGKQAADQASLGAAPGKSPLYFVILGKHYWSREVIDRVIVGWADPCWPRSPLQLTGQASSSSALK